MLICAGRIAAGEGRFNTNTEVIINTEVKSIPVTKKGVYFAFRDQGACISLLAIKVRTLQPYVSLQEFLFFFRPHLISTHLISVLLLKRRKRLNDKYALFLLGLTQISFNASPSSDSYLYWRAGITSLVKFDTPTYQSTEKFLLLLITPHNLLLS